MSRVKSSVVAFAAILCLGGPVFAGDIDHRDLLITGLLLEVDTATVVANAGIPAAVQTKFGGKINDDAPPDNGMTAVGELSGPGIDTPIRLVTKPGHLFQLPVLGVKGDYILRNIRLLSADGKVLQTAVPSFANITISQVLDTKISVRQLTPDDLRARGITVDANNYDVYVEHGPRGIATTTDYDEIGRPVHIRAEGQELSPEEYFAYDGNGRLARHRRQQGDRQIEERYEYDVAGRLTKSSLFDGATEVESTTTDYFVTAPNAISTHLPGGGTRGESKVLGSSNRKRSPHSSEDAIPRCSAGKCV